MLWKEHTVRVISPPRARPPNIIGPEALRKVAAGYRAPHIFGEPGHEANCDIDESDRQPRRPPISRRHDRTVLPAGKQIRVPAEAACEIMHKALPRKRRRRRGQSLVRGMSHERIFARSAADA
jgi:hypothetical protein